MFGLSNLGLGFAAGFGAGFVTRDLASSGDSMVRPLFKFIVKSSIKAMEKTRESMAHFSETFEDLVAEARSEVSMESREAISDEAREPIVVTADATETVAVELDEVRVRPASARQQQAKRTKHRSRRVG